MNPFNVLLVGTGNMGRHHLRLLSQSDEFKLVAVIEPNKLPTNSSYQGPVFDSLDSLTGVEFDCAVVASPTETHYQIVEQLLAKGCHVLVEKPAASTYSQAKHLVSVAEANNLLLAVGNIERCNPVVSMLKNVMSCGIIGTPVHFTAVRAGAYPNAVKDGNNVVLDLAVHDLDVFRMILGPLEPLAAIGHSSLQQGIIDTAEITVKSSQGITGSVHVNWLCPQKIRQIRVVASQGVCEVDYLSQTCTLYGKELDRLLLDSLGDYEELDQAFCEGFVLGVKPSESLQVQLDNWLKMLNHKPHSLACGDELIESVWLAEQALEKMGIVGMTSSGGRWTPYFETSASRSEGGN